MWPERVGVVVVGEGGGCLVVTTAETSAAIYPALVNNSKHGKC